MTPMTCGDSIKIDNVYICILLTTPCPMHFGRRCEVERVDEAIERFASGMKGDGNEQDV